MTNKEAIEALEQMRANICNDYRWLALDLAIKALETLDSCTYFKQSACGKCTHYEEAENEQTTD